MSNDNIIRHEEAYYPSAGYGGWSEERWQWLQEHSTIIYHPVYDPAPVKQKPGFWAQALAWVLTTMGLAAP